MLVLVTEYFKNGDPEPVYKRLAEKGRMLPEGVIYINSYVSQDLKTAWQIMETDDFYKIYDWMAHWQDLVEFEVEKIYAASDAQHLVMSESKTLPEKPKTIKSENPKYVTPPKIPEDRLWEVFVEPTKTVLGFTTQSQNVLTHFGKRVATFDYSSPLDWPPAETTLNVDRTLWPLPSKSVTLSYATKTIEGTEGPVTVCTGIRISNDIQNWPGYQAFSEKYIDEWGTAIKRANTYLRFKPHGSHYGIFDPDGEIIVSIHPPWRDKDLARKVMYQFQSHVKESNPLLNMALVFACGIVGRRIYRG